MTNINRRDMVSRLAPAAPPCFRTHHQWVEFLVSASEEQRTDSKRGPLDLRRPVARFNTEFDFCEDCPATFALQMLDEGRCDPKHLTRCAKVLAPGETA